VSRLCEPLRLARSAWPLLTISDTALVIVLIYMFPTVVDQHLGFAPALRASIGLLRGPVPWRTSIAVGIPYLAVELAWYLAALLGRAGSALMTLLAPAQLILLPLPLVYLTCMYFRARAEEHLLESAIAEVETPAA
jgi:hypothetical protein